MCSAPPAVNAVGLDEIQFACEDPSADIRQSETTAAKPIPRVGVLMIVFGMQAPLQPFDERGCSIGERTEQGDDLGHVDQTPDRVLVECGHNLV